MLVNLIKPATGSIVDGSMWFRLPKQEIKLRIRLYVGAVLFAPMHIDTVIVDLASKQLVLVRRVVVSAKAEVRQLELGTWAEGTMMEVTPATAEQTASATSGVAHG